MKKGREFSVFRSSSPSQHHPDNRNIRKQRSLGNLTLLSDGEQKVYSFELDGPTKAEAGQRKPDGQKNPKEGGPSRARSLSLSLTKMLSQSEHSLIPVPWGQKVGRPGSKRAEPTAKMKQQAGQEEDPEDDEDLKPSGAGEWAEEIESAREERAELDKEVILTMLGDLEQVLNTHKAPMRKLNLQKLRLMFIFKSSDAVVNKAYIKCNIDRQSAVQNRHACWLTDADKPDYMKLHGSEKYCNLNDFLELGSIL